MYFCIVSVIPLGILIYIMYDVIANQKRFVTLTNTFLGIMFIGWVIFSINIYVNRIFGDLIDCVMWDELLKYN